MDEVFQALADPTRRDIIARLAQEGDASLTALAAPYDMSLQAVAKHVAVLTDAGLVSRRRDGRERPVHLEATVLSMATGWLERRRREAEERYRRLDSLLDELADDRPRPTPDDAPASSAPTSSEDDR